MAATRWASPRQALAVLRGAFARWRGSSTVGWSDATVWLVLLLASLMQRPGLVTFDTKLDLAVNPAAFLGRATHLWNAESAFGELQNQAYGYLFPQGPFFLLVEVLPAWLVQRLWSALVLIVAYEGARRVARLIGIGEKPWVWQVAGLAFALSPRLLGLSGVLTAEVLPTAVLPWVVLPLLHGLRGRFRPLTAAALSGTAVLAMGGVNAVENLATLPLPMLLLAYSLRQSLGRRLAAWWLLAVALASSWWMLPLFLLGRYSPPFLNYIETASATTDPLGWANVLRGADHWLSFLIVGGQPYWPGSYDLSTSPVLIVLTMVVAAISMLGLFHPAMPLRRPLAVSALLGMVLLAVAHDGWAGSPIASIMQGLLDGVLAPLRNVHKVDPLVRLPLALGFAQACVLLPRWASERWPAPGTRRWLGSGRLVRPVVLASLCLLLAGSAQPVLNADLRKTGWREIPAAWQQAADFLAEAGADGRTLVLPGAGSGRQTWGWTVDEPLQALGSSPWVARTQVPLVPGPTIRLMDSIENVVQDGAGSDSLADLLAGAGLTYVLVRRDLDVFAADAPSTSRVDQAISQSRGLRLVASFGSSGFGDQSLIDIYQVNRESTQVRAVNSADVVTLAGGPEDLLPALEADALQPGQVTVNAAEPDWGRAPDLVGDAYRRQERQFSRQIDATSQVMAGDEPYRTSRVAHDYPGVVGARPVTANYQQVREVTASSSASYVDNFGALDPALAPWAALDSDIETFWQSGPLQRPTGQWIEVTLAEKMPLTSLTIFTGADGSAGARIRSVRVDAGRQRAEASVNPETGRVDIQLPGQPVDRLRITVTATRGEPRQGVVAFREIRLPGLTPTRALAVPDSEADAEAGFVFSTRASRRTCLRAVYGTVCEPDAALVSAEDAGMSRTFVTESAGRYTISGTVTARSRSGARALLEPLGGPFLRSSSVLGGDLAVSPVFAADGDPSTSWVAERGDSSPELTITLPRARRISSLSIASADAWVAPGEVVIEARGQRRVVNLGAGEIGQFQPLRARTFTLTMRRAGDRLISRTDAFGIAELRLGGAADLLYGPPPDAPTGAICGFGPTLVVDSQVRNTRVRGTIEDLLSGRALQWETCGAPVALKAGAHQFNVASTDQFAVSRVHLAPSDAGSGRGEDPADAPNVGAASRDRATNVEEWGDGERVVEVGPGDEAILVVSENVNPGWRASLDGSELAPIAVDGWRQGYLVPAGAGGQVRLTFAPDSTYRGVLLFGLSSAMVLIIASGIGLVRDRSRSLGVLGLSAPVRDRARPALAWRLAAVGIAFALGGVGLAAGGLAGLLGGPRRGWRVAPVAAIVAGVLAAVGAADLSGLGVLGASVNSDLVGSIADLLAAGAVGLWATTLLTGGSSEGEARE